LDSVFNIVFNSLPDFKVVLVLFLNGLFTSIGASLGSFFATRYFLKHLDKKKK